MSLPHLPSVFRTPLVFLTVCTHRRQAILAAGPIHLILQAHWQTAAAKHGWFVGNYVVMPDHVHFFASPAREACSLAEWMRRWKGASAYEINHASCRRGTVWQADYFDRYLRSRDNYAQKWTYVENNPVRHGLVDNAEAWPFRGAIHELRSSKPRD